MPIQPVIPVYRVTFPFVVLGFPHVQHFLCGVTPSADPSGFDIIARAGYVNKGTSFCMTAWWTTIKTLYNAAADILGNAHLDHFAGGTWNLVWTETNAVAATGGAQVPYANEVTWSAYATNHEKMKVIHQEQNIPYFTKQTSYASLNAGLKPISDALFNANGGAASGNPYTWMKSRGDFYVGSWVSAVGMLNHHWRRKRGMA